MRGTEELQYGTWTQADRSLHLCSSMRVPMDAIWVFVCHTCSACCSQKAQGQRQNWSCTKTLQALEARINQCVVCVTGVECEAPMACVSIAKREAQKDRVFLLNVKSKGLALWRFCMRSDKSASWRPHVRLWRPTSQRTNARLHLPAFPTWSTWLCWEARGSLFKPKREALAETRGLDHQRRADGPRFLTRCPLLWHRGYGSC